MEDMLIVRASVVTRSNHVDEVDVRPSSLRSNVLVDRYLMSFSFFQ